MQRCHLLASLLLTTITLPAWADPESAAQFEVQRVQGLLWHSASAWQKPLDGRAAPAAWRAELRPDFQLTQSPWRMQLRPRLLLQREQAQDGQADLWLNEGTLGWQGERAGVQAGRAVVLWGPSMFRVLANPLWPDNGRSDPQRKLAGHDLARLDYAFSRTVELQLIRQFSHGHESNAGQRSEQVSLLHVQLTGAAAAGDIVLSRRRGESARLGMAGQITASDALLLYADSTVGRRVPGNLSQLALGDGPRLDWLAGLAWTFESGHTLHAEYFWNGSGLSHSEADAWQNLWQNASASGRAALLDPLPTPSGRRHLALQLMSSDASTSGWLLRTQHGLDDGSGEIFAQVSHEVDEACQLWASVLTHYGASDTDYNRSLRYRIQAGLTFYFR